MSNQPSQIVLIFDFDGTIADTFHYILQLSEALAEEFHFQKIRHDEVDRLKDFSLLEIIHHLKVPLFKIPLILNRARQELHKDILRIAPIQNLKKPLSQLKAAGIKMGILSSNSTQNIQKFLEIHHLNFFDFIYSSSKVWGKNHTLNHIVKRHGLSSQQVFYIGDETRDVEAAQKAGLGSAAVTWGYNSAKALEAHKPDYLLHHPEDFTRIFTPQNTSS